MLSKANEQLRRIVAAQSLLATDGMALPAFMDMVVDRISVLTGASGAAIEFQDGDRMLCRAASGTLAQHAGERLNPQADFSALSVRSGEIMLSADTSADPRVDAATCKKDRALSIVTVPVLQRGKAMGVLKAVSEKTDAFDEHDVQTLQLMAGLLGAALGQHAEIERRQLLEEQLRHVAHNDALTGLPNRALFEDRLEHALYNSTRTKKPLALMHMDIDHFKTINDTYGHAGGDLLLKAFAARVTGALRAGDTLARLGGDEFVLVAENIHGESDAQMLAAKIMQAVGHEFDIQTDQLKIGVSIGVAVSSPSDRTPGDLMRRADEALFEAKRAGRNGFRLAA